MKKVLSLFAVLACMVMLGSAAFAAPITTKSAYASFTGGSVSFSADLFTWNSSYTGASASSVTWTTSTGINLGQTSAQFKCADVYALIKSTITTGSGKVWMYQDNANNTSPYQATSGRVDGSDTVWSGLVKGDSNGGENGYAPMSSYFITKSSAMANITTLPASFPTYGKRYFADKSNSNFESQQTTYTVVATSAGNYVGDASGTVNNYVKEDVVMFIGAEFSNVVGGDSFGTTTIMFLSQIE